MVAPPHQLLARNALEKRDSCLPLEDHPNLLVSGELQISSNSLQRRNPIFHDAS
jgi:hypothetical protein